MSPSSFARTLRPVLAAVVLFLLCFVPTAQAARPTPAIPFDQQFIDMMVPHHQGATAMATIALSRGQHAQIKHLAQAIITAQNTEITQMHAWRKAWYGSAATPKSMPMLPGMPMGSMSTNNMEQAIAALKTAKPFDKTFILAMIPHHQAAVAAAKLELAQGTHAQLKVLALSIIEAQAHEIGQMTAYLDLWYTSARPGGMGSMSGM